MIGVREKHMQNAQERKQVEWGQRKNKKSLRKREEEREKGREGQTYLARVSSALSSMQFRSHEGRRAVVSDVHQIRLARYQRGNTKV